MRPSSLGRTMARTATRPGCPPHPPRDRLQRRGRSLRPPLRGKPPHPRLRPGLRRLLTWRRILWRQKPTKSAGWRLRHYRSPTPPPRYPIFVTCSNAARKPARSSTPSTSPHHGRHFKTITIDRLTRFNQRRHQWRGHRPAKKPGKASYRLRSVRGVTGNRRPSAAAWLTNLGLASRQPPAVGAHGLGQYPHRLTSRRVLFSTLS